MAVEGAAATGAGRPLPSALARPLRSPMLRAFFRAPSGLIGLVILALVTANAVLAPRLLSERANEINVAAQHQPPSAEFLLGTDQLGRDILARTLVASELSLQYALGAALVALVVGTLMGTSVAVLSDRLRPLLQRFIDTMIGFPGIIIVIIIATILGTGATGAMVGVGIAASFAFARFISTFAMALGGRDFVHAARISGLPSTRVMYRHVLPNLAEPMIVSLSFILASALLTFASLSFLGLGVQPPAYDWGRLLTEGVRLIYSAPAAALGPAAALALTALAFGFFGEALARATNPLLWTVSKEEQGRLGTGTDLRLGLGNAPPTAAAAAAPGAATDDLALDTPARAPDDRGAPGDFRQRSFDDRDRPDQPEPGGPDSFRDHREPGEPDEPDEPDLREDGDTDSGDEPDLREDGDTDTADEPDEPDDPDELDEDCLLAVRGLTVTFPGPQGPADVVKGVSLSMPEGAALGIVGESGSGKTMTTLAIAQLVGYPGTVNGTVALRGRTISGGGDKTDRLLGTDIAFVFQDPMSSLNPALSIGTQLTESVRAHGKVSRKAAAELAVSRLQEVNIPAPKAQMRRFPHELSGGMRQRAMIAMALMNEPALLICDEPTTALDVTIQAQIMELLSTIHEERGTSIILISHNLALVAQNCDRVLVMYAGRVVEDLTTEQLLSGPRHPYTQALLGSIPQIGRSREEPLVSIPGEIPEPSAEPAGCAFHPRCPLAVERCRTQRPPLRRQSDGGRVACWVADEDEG